MKTSIKLILSFFDKLEDRVRIRLSHYPIVYAIIVGTAVVLFWRGIWHAADTTPILQNSFVSILIAFLTLLLTGNLISSFVGNEIIISGIKNEKKAIENAAIDEIEVIEKLGDKIIISTTLNEKKAIANTAINETKIIKEEDFEILKLKKLEAEIKEIKNILKRMEKPKKEAKKTKSLKTTK